MFECTFCQTPFPTKASLQKHEQLCSSATSDVNASANDTENENENEKKKNDNAAASSSSASPNARSKVEREAAIRSFMRAQSSRVAAFAYNDALPRPDKLDRRCKSVSRGLLSGRLPVLKREPCLKLAALLLAIKESKRFKRCHVQLIGERVVDDVKNDDDDLQRLADSFICGSVRGSLNEEKNVRLCRDIVAEARRQWKSAAGNVAAGDVDVTLRWRFVQLAEALPTHDIRVYSDCTLYRSTLGERYPVKSALSVGITRQSTIMVLTQPSRLERLSRHPPPHKLVAMWPLTHLLRFGLLRDKGINLLRLHVGAAGAEVNFRSDDAKKMYGHLKSLAEELTQREVSDRDILVARVAKLGFEVRSIVGDGNCQYRAVADQLHDDESRHKQMRRAAIKWLEENPDFAADPSEQAFAIRNFIDTDVYSTWQDYCSYHAGDCRWGDHITLLALAQVSRVNIHVFSSLHDARDVTVIESRQPSTHNIYLCHWHGVHYSSLRHKDGKKSSKKDANRSNCSSDSDN
jgi:OTU-like cysteine protease